MGASVYAPAGRKRRGITIKPGEGNTHPADEFTNSLHFPALPDTANRHNSRLLSHDKNHVKTMDLW
ncbi:hypothetical protein E4Z61_03205 [Citrobacter tructae]|uniref:Uncharacterized protein n=1 Tax=Citrobacter tructae TaxID=2562449 RepID=A0ABX5T279_9ENTR|nr:hypothetical protein E4Z61_03205 [Citrobacter tructae]